MPYNRLRKLNLDALGIGASLICAIHCAVLPLLVTILPLLGLEILENEKLEYGLLAFTLFVGGASLFRGYRYCYHHVRPLLLFALGFLLLLSGHFLAAGHWEPVFISTGALLIITAHTWNLRASRHCKVCNHDHNK
ncbi:MerC domain-containing protein [Chitinophaga japonensis]|uniref:MerC mercury resistance protein n=1 Tax=Chitinophaga japonensis TaxID=104662 RepID=A0A562TD79_CHIJA|nr:MerC domain-containing protein [Chitinophaga japonensis]TWI91511.1 MerC mercury resistance protein [Chitinophaga japonensis]